VRPQTHTIDRAATGIDFSSTYTYICTGISNIQTLTLTLTPTNPSGCTPEQKIRLVKSVLLTAVWLKVQGFWMLCPVDVSENNNIFIFKFQQTKIKVGNNFHGVTCRTT
jgi:hypothetical protein